MVKVYSKENITVKIPRRLLDVTRRLKAKLMLAENKRVTDAEVIETIFSVACANENELFKQKKVSFLTALE